MIGAASAAVVAAGSLSGNEYAEILNGSSFVPVPVPDVDPANLSTASINLSTALENTPSFKLTLSAKAFASKTYDGSSVVGIGFPPEYKEDLVLGYLASID